MPKETAVEKIIITVSAHINPADVTLEKLEIKSRHGPKFTVARLLLKASEILFEEIQKEKHD